MMAGGELAERILEKCGKVFEGTKDIPYIDYPPEYWVGWILAYYQWYTGRSFSAICKKLPYQSILDMYGVLHEADPRKAVSVFEGMMTKDGETNLAKVLGYLVEDMLEGKGRDYKGFLQSWKVGTVILKFWLYLFYKSF